MKFKILYIFLSISFLSACATTPTGRRQLRYLPESQMAQMGQAAFVQMQSQGKTIANSSTESKRVRCIVDRLLVVMGETPSAWKVEVFQDESANAFALPGRNIGVHTGMMKLVENDDQLAAVIGHEIAHVLAHHGNERASQQLLVQGGLSVAQVYIGSNSATDQMLLGALGLGAQVGVLLPFSRKHESEADELGIEYLAEAGFDPRQASRLWEIMGAKHKNAGPQFMSTHPSSTARAQTLKKKAESLMTVYQSSRGKYPRCSK